MDWTDIPDNSNQPKAAEEAYNPILCQPVDDGSCPAPSTSSLCLDKKRLLEDRDHAASKKAQQRIKLNVHTISDDDAVIVDSNFKEYCDDLNNSEASTSTEEVIPDELDFDEEFLAEEMNNRNVDSHVSILSCLPSNPSDLAIEGAKILKRSLQKYVDSGCPEDNHYAGLTRYSSLDAFLSDPQVDGLLANVLNCMVPLILKDMLSGKFDITQISRERLDQYESASLLHHKGRELDTGNFYGKLWCLTIEEWKKVNSDHRNEQGKPDFLGTFTQRVVNNGVAMDLEDTKTINAAYMGETSMQTVEKRWDGKYPGWIENHLEPTNKIRIATFEGRKPQLSRMIESILAGFMACTSTVTRLRAGRSEVKLLRRDGTSPNTIPCGERKWRMSGTEVVHFLKAIDKETLKSTVVAVSNLPPNVRDLEEIMRPTIIAWLNSPKDKRGVYGGVPENVPEDEPQTAFFVGWVIVVEPKMVCCGSYFGPFVPPTTPLWQRVMASKNSLTCLELRMIACTNVWFQALLLANELDSILQLHQTHLQ